MKVKYKTGTQVNFRLKFAFLSLSMLAVLTVFLLVKDFVLTHDTKAESGKQIIETRKQLIFHREVNKEDEIFQDSRPLISQDGKQLFFGRRNHPKNVGGKEDFQDIWVATLDTTGQFGKIHSLGTIINNSKPNGICSISPDGREIILTNEYDKSKTAPICRSVKDNGIWSKPQPIFIQDYYNRSQYEDFYMAFEHKVLFMAVERKDGKGDQDLYISLPDESGNWKTPVNLGASVNTSSAEFAPYLASDGKTLFFSSYREGGLGESDIYATKRLDETWTNWSEPVNLGPSVNSPNEESYFSLTSDFEKVFVESYAKGSSTRKIFQVEVPEAFKPQTENLMVSSN